MKFHRPDTVIQFALKQGTELVMDDVRKIREQFPVTKHKVFLDHAAQSPLPRPVADAIRKFVEESSDFATTPSTPRDDGKREFAKIIGAKHGEIALVENTSIGLNIAANMLHYPHGSKIVTTDMEYVSVVYPWLTKRLDARVHYVKSTNGKISLDDMERAVDDKTVVVAISHVEYINGFRHNLRVLSEIAHEHGAYLIVDGIQSAGTMPIDIRRDDVDFFVAACYKWLLGPTGAGYLYVRDDLIGRLEPPFVGWASVDQDEYETADSYDMRKLRLSKTASRFEVGSPSTISFVGAKEAMKMLLEYGTENVKKRIVKLTDYLIDALKNLGVKLQTPEDKQCRSGIVTFNTRRSMKLADELKKRGIVVSAMSNGIRVSPHFYNTEDEIDRLVNEIRKSERQNL